MKSQYAHKLHDQYYAAIARSVLQTSDPSETFTQFRGCLALTFGSRSRSGRVSSRTAAIETTASVISEVSREPKLSKNSQQRQHKIDQQATKISSLEAQNQKLAQLLEPKFLVETITKAVASNLNINIDKKSSQNESGYTGKPYLGKPRPSKFALGIDGSLNPELSCWYCKDTGHLKENCIKLNRRLALENKQPEWLPSKKTGKLRPPLAMDQSKGEIVSGPHGYEESSLMVQLRNTAISPETRMEIMQCAVAKCPKVCINAHRVLIPSLLDSSSEVTLLRQSYFDQYILPKIKLATGEKADTHWLFKLTVANDGQMPIKMYTELDLTFLGLKVPKVGVLIAEEPNQVLDKKHQTRLPGIIGWNLIQLSYDMFIKKYGTTGFDSFICPEGVNPLLFSQLCIYHHFDVQKNNALGATSEVMSQNIKISKSPKTDDLSKKKDQLYFKGKTGAIGQVTVGSRESPVCIPGNSALTVPGQTNKIPAKLTCLVEQAQHHNLPPGIVINRCLTTTKARSVPVILVNTNRQNVWIQQPLLATELFGTNQVEEIEHRANMEREGDNI